MVATAQIIGGGRTPSQLLLCYLYRGRVSTVRLGRGPRATGSNIRYAQRGLDDCVAKRVPSAKADSVLPTLLSRHLRAGLSRCRRSAAGAWFIPLTVTITGFRKPLGRPLLRSPLQYEVDCDLRFHFNRLAIQVIRAVLPLPDRIECSSIQQRLPANYLRLLDPAI